MLPIKLAFREQHHEQNSVFCEDSKYLSVTLVLNYL